MSTTALPNVWSTLLSATIEFWIDQILHRRNVYPPETFGKKSFLGIPCSVCEHPHVRSYIQEALPVLVSSLIQAISNELQLSIIELNPTNDDPLDVAAGHGSEDAILQPPYRVLEKYILRFHLESNMQQLLEDRYTQQQQQQQTNISSHPMSTTWQDMMLELECGMRNLILSTQTLPAVSSNDQSLDRSFQLSLHIPEANATCPELNRVLSQGSWYIPSATPLNHFLDRPAKDSQPASRVIRPIHQYSDARMGSIQFACVK